MRQESIRELSDHAGIYLLSSELWENVTDKCSESYVCTHFSKPWSLS